MISDEGRLQLSCLSNDKHMQRPLRQVNRLQERHLCITERLLPHQYLAYKASLLREAEREGAAFTRSKAKYMFRLRSPLALKIYDFLVSCRWISGPQALLAGGPQGSTCCSIVARPLSKISGIDETYQKQFH